MKISFMCVRLQRNEKAVGFGITVHDNLIDN